MKNWISKNYKTLIIAAFLIPILTVAIVSISHVTEWYGISNPVTWAVYLSIGIEIAALSALAAISANMGSKVYFPFAIVTVVQFIGNIFFAYSYINIDTKQFKDWVDLVAPLVEFMGVDPTDYVGHKRFLALFSGGMLPLISLSFLHMLVKFTEEDRLAPKPVADEPVKINSSEVVSEVSRLRLSEDDLLTLQRILDNPPAPNEALVNAAKKYKESKEEPVPVVDEVLPKQEVIEEVVVEPTITSQNEDETVVTTNELESNDDGTFDLDLTIVKTPEEVVPEVTPEEVVLVEDVPVEIPAVKSNFETMMDEVAERKKSRGELLAEIMASDQELGLYDEPAERFEPKDLDVIVDPVDQEVETTETIEDTYTIAQSIQEDVVVQSLSEDDVNQMLLDEWERNNEFSDDPNFFQEEPTNDEESQNFSTIEENNTNIFQEEVQKFNIDDAYPQKDDIDIANEQQNTFWRDHLRDIEEDLKKK